MAIMSKYIFNTVILFTLILSICKVQSQKKEPLTFHKIKNGISQSTATVLLEDSFGFIWIGTRNGLNRYDGKDFEIFDKSLDNFEGLTDEYIVSLYEDDENLLIGTNHGLSLYDRGLNIVRPYKFKNGGNEMDSKRFESITRINGILWLGTETDGLYSYNTETGELKHFLITRELLNFKNPKADKIINVMPLDDKRILVISSYYFFIISKDMKILTKTPETDEITTAIQLDNNNFSLGTSNGLLIELNVSAASDLLTKKKNISPGFSIRSLAENGNDELWIGTENNGLFIYSKALNSIRHIEHSVTRPNSLSGNSIWSLLSTRNGVMWVAPYKSGLNFYDPELIKFKHINTDPFNPQSLSNNLVNCFTEDTKGNLWIGTDGGGLNYWDRTLDTFEHYSLKDKNFGSNVVLSILQNKKDELWAGTWANGITIFNTESKKFKELNTQNSFLISNNISGLLKDKKDRIWIINFFGGVQIYNPQTKSHETINLVSEIDGTEINSMYHIFEDNKGHIWIGTLNSGLFKLTESDSGWKIVQYNNVNTKRSLSNNFVNTIVQDSSSIIWVGTQAGLNKYLPESDSFQAITKSDGLRNDAIKGIIADKNNHLWLSTEFGITRYNTISGKTIDYGVGDGVQSNEFNANSFLTTSSGEYVFGGIRGFNIFTASKVEKRKDKPPLFISELKVFNKHVLPNDDSGILKKAVSQVDSLTFNYKQSVININFKALTFRHPERVHYAYFLDGFETKWNYVGNNPSATYTNLDPGEYTLRMKSTNSDGVWVDNELDIHIEILSPFWGTWWFRTLVAALVLLSFYSAYNIKLRNIKKNQRRLESKIAERTKELQHQKDKLVEAANELESKNEEIQRFTFAVSHDLKSPLSNIQGIASLIPMEIEMKDFPNIEEYLGFIDVSCNNMNELISDITEIARLGKIENKNEVLNTNKLLKLERNLISAKLRTGNIQLNIADNLPDIYGDRKRIIQVFGNLLDNAIKYMGEQPNPIITISVEENGDTNSFLVRDNGSGMDKHSLKKVFSAFERFHSDVKGTGLGLYMIKQIAVSHGGTIIAESEGKGKGTTFKLILPTAKIAAQKANK